MASVRIKIIVGVVAILGALVYLGRAATSSSWMYFVDVDAFVESSKPIGQRARVHGVVAPDPDVRRVEMYAGFTVQGRAQRLDVVYHGPVPDLFQAGRQVVLEGSVDQAGVFQADTLLTKCESKYEAHQTANAAAPGPSAAHP